MHGSPAPRPVQPFHGPRGVAAAFVIAIFGWGVGFYGPPVYLEVVREGRGWPVTLLSGAVTLHFLAGVLVVANLPRLHARWGLPWVTAARAVILALGVLGWALAEAPWQLYAATLLSGAGWPALGAAALNAMIAPWYVQRRPAALGTAYNGASLGGVIFLPLWVALIAGLGFPLAAGIVGAVLVATVGALAFTVLARTPEGMSQEPDGGLVDPTRLRAAASDPAPLAGSPWADPRFRTLTAGMALALFAQIGLLAQLVSMLVPTMGPQGAGLAAGLATAAAILGRQLAAWLMAQGSDRRALAAACLLVQAAGCGVLLLAGGSAALVLLGSALFGAGIGNATSLPPLIAQRELARAEVARVTSLAIGTTQATYALAPGAFGLLRATLGDPVVLVAAMAVQAAAAGVYLAGRKRPTSR